MLRGERQGSQRHKATTEPTTKRKEEKKKKKTNTNQKQRPHTKTPEKKNKKKKKKKKKKTKKQITKRNRKKKSNTVPSIPGEMPRLMGGKNLQERRVLEAILSIPPFFLVPSLDHRPPLVFRNTIASR